MIPQRCSVTSIYAAGWIKQYGINEKSLLKALLQQGSDVLRV
jgi:hypothetical protein